MSLVPVGTSPRCSGSRLPPAKQAKGSWTFDVRAKSAKEGEMHWTGKVQGGKVSGKVVWAKQGQKAINYVFAGALKK